MRALAFLCAALIVSSADAQLNPAEFKVSDKPAPFDEKAAFAAPSGFATVKKDAPLWTSQLEFGLSGNEGNSNAMAARLGCSTIRQTEGNIFTSDLIYSLKRQMGVTAEDKALFNIRDEYYFQDSPWGLFISGQVEYDQFRAYDFRVAGHTGFAYQFIKNDSTSFRSRLGAGVSREIGDAPSQWVPEGLLGIDFAHKFDARQQFITTVDFYPDLGRPERYRIRARAAYEVSIDPECRFRIRIGLQDRYDSQPGNAKRNDVDYFTSLLVKF